MDERQYASHEVHSGVKLTAKEFLLRDVNALADRIWRARADGSDAEKDDRLFETLLNLLTLQHYTILQIRQSQAMNGIHAQDRIQGLLTSCHAQGCEFKWTEIEQRCRLAATFLSARGRFVVSGKSICRVYADGENDTHECRITASMKLAVEMVSMESIPSSQIRAIRHEQRYFRRVDDESHEYSQHQSRLMSRVDIFEYCKNQQSAYFWIEELFGILDPDYFEWPWASIDFHAFDPKRVHVLALEEDTGETNVQDKSVPSLDLKKRPSVNDCPDRPWREHDISHSQDNVSRAHDMSANLANSQYRKLALATASCSLFVLANDIETKFPEYNLIISARAREVVGLFQNSKSKLAMIWRVAVGVFAHALIALDVSPYSTSSVLLSLQIERQNSYVDLLSKPPVLDEAISELIDTLQNTMIERESEPSSLHKILVHMAMAVCNKLGQDHD